mmetsp:Transcript_15183/g.35082  ORF Transcript_15183/g.35082 Transcript_15183/m.35082 type:complete len:445 (+) Transcript_15183:127-1461(+)
MLQYCRRAVGQLVLLVCLGQGFVVVVQNNSGATTSLSSLADGADSLQPGGRSELYIYSVDSLVESSLCRSRIAIQAARRVWPEEVRKTEDALGNFENFDWLANKMSALYSITQIGDSPDAMLGTDAVFLSRLLLEEQLLDKGRSKGKGKYGSRYHPAPVDCRENVNSSKVGSRPLTVGECWANWHELREVLRMKYSIDGKLDPLPRIREALAEQYKQICNGEETSPTLMPCFHDFVLEDTSSSGGQLLRARRNTALLLGHESQLNWILSTLSAAFGSIEVDFSPEVSFPFNSKYTQKGGRLKVLVGHAESIVPIRQRQSGSPHTPIVLLVPKIGDEESQSNMVETIVEQYHPTNKMISVVHSSLEVLKRCKMFLGEDPPGVWGGVGRCELPNSDAKVTLIFPKWAENMSMTHDNDAEMDPWLNSISERSLVEETSARILQAPNR